MFCQPVLKTHDDFGLHPEMLTHVLPAAAVLRDERFELAPFDPLIDRCDDAFPVARRQLVQIRHFGNFHLGRSGRCCHPRRFGFFGAIVETGKFVSALVD